MAKCHAAPDEPQYVRVAALHPLGKQIEHQQKKRECIRVANDPGKRCGCGVCS